MRVNIRELKRRINNLENEEGVKFPRPGPSLKPFEDFNPKATED